MHIYKIFLNDILLYIGSTTNIQRRKWQHKNGLKNNVDEPLYRYLRENNINYDELVFEEILCRGLSIEGLRYTEGNYIRFMNPLINTRIEGVDYKNNKEYQKEYYKEYRELNAEIIKKQKKIYQKENQDKIKEYQKKWYNDNIEKLKKLNKKWRELNYEQNKEKSKQYYEQNKELIIKKRQERKELNKIFNKIYNHFY